MKRVWWIHKKTKYFLQISNNFHFFEDMIGPVYGIMKCFMSFLTLKISVSHHQNLKLIKLCLISVKLITLFFQYCTKSQSAVSGIKFGDLIKNIFSTLMVDFSDSSIISTYIQATQNQMTQPILSSPLSQLSNKSSVVSSIHIPYAQCTWDLYV